jgi:aminoglycoside 6'-N-acetyltransferase I
VNRRPEPALAEKGGQLRLIYGRIFYMEVRKAIVTDLEDLVPLRHALWPEGPREEHRSELQDILEGSPPGTMPLICLVATDGDALLGFAEVGLRSHADGCNPAHSCGFLEGWYVKPSARNQGVGRALVSAAEDWARMRGCVEMASDTWMDNVESQRAHAALGFEVVDRCVNYRQDLLD